MAATIRRMCNRPPFARVCECNRLAWSTS